MPDMVYFAALAGSGHRAWGLKPEYRSQPGRLRRPGRGLNAIERNHSAAHSLMLGHRVFKRMNRLCVATTS